MFVLQVYKSNDYNVNLLFCNCQQMALKQDSMHFGICPKQGNKIEGVDLAKQGQGFKLSMAPLYPNIGQVPPALGSSHIIFTTH